MGVVRIDYNPALARAGVIIPLLVAALSTDTTTAQQNAATLTAALNMASVAGQTVRVATPGTYYMARPTTNYDAAIQAEQLIGVTLDTARGVTYKLADGANCYIEHWHKCIDCNSLGGTWDGNVANNGTVAPPVWWAGWHGDLCWIDGCTRFQKRNSMVTADPTYQGANAVIHGIWVTGSSHDNTPSSFITVADNDLNMQRDAIHICGPLHHFSFVRNKGFHGDNFYGIGTADYPAHQISFGSVTDGLIEDTQVAGGLQAPISFFGRNENEQVAGGTATRVKMERITVRGARGAVQNIGITSVVHGAVNTTINTSEAGLWRNGVVVTITGALGTGWSVLNGNFAVTQVTPTQFTIPLNTGALVDGNYTASSATVSSCASGIQIADDSAGGAGNSYAGLSVTSLTLSGNLKTATVTPSAMSIGAGGTYAPIIPGSIMVVDSAGTNETVQVLYVLYTGLAALPTQFVCIKTNGANFTNAAGTYAGKTLTGTSPGVLTGLYVDSMLWDDIAIKTTTTTPVASLTGTGIQTLALRKLHAGLKNANFGAITAIGTIGNLLVDTLTTDQTFNGTGLVFGATCNVKKWSMSNCVIDGTGGNATNIGVTVGGTLGNGVMHNCHNVAGSQFVNCPTTASYLAAPTFFEIIGCTTAGSGLLISWGAGAGAASECLITACYNLSGGGTTISLTGANAQILTVRMAACHTSTVSMTATATQKCRVIGDTSLKLDGTIVNAAPTAGDSFWNTNAAFGTGIGYYIYTNAGAWAKVA